MQLELARRPEAAKGLSVTFQSRNLPVACPPKVRTVLWDLETDETLAQLEPLIEQADVVVNLIGATPGAGTDDAMFRRLNVDFPCRLLDLIARHPGVRCVLISSAAVYGVPVGPAPLHEDSPLNPASAYGASKCAMEEAARRHPVADRVNCLRIANISGADALLGGALGSDRPSPLLLDQFANGKGPQRSYVAPFDLAAMLFDLIRLPSLPDVLNISSGPPVFMDDLLTQLGKSGAGLDWSFRPAPPSATERVVLDVGRLARLAPPTIARAARRSTSTERDLVTQALEFAAARSPTSRSAA